MFGSSKVSDVVENAINNNNIDINGKRVSIMALILGIIFVIILNILVGPWLWNNIARRLIPNLGIARWYDTVALALLLGLVIPH